MIKIKKILIMSVLFLVIAIPAFAANSTSGSQNSPTGTQTQTQLQLRVSPSPTGSAVQNQNQVKTQNQGEDQKLMVQTQEQETMNLVGEQVQMLMQLKTTGETGNRVKEIAQIQEQAQEEIQTNLDKINSRGTAAKIFLGTDYKALNGLKQQLEQNRLRIQELQELQLKVYNQSDSTAIENAIQALTDVNTSLQEKIDTEDDVVSLLGWLIKLFVK